MADSADRHVPNDITRQVTSLARAIDRLPPGEYVIRLEKSTRLDTWRAEIATAGEKIRDMELRRETDTKG